MQRTIQQDLWCSGAPFWQCGSRRGSRVKKVSSQVGAGATFLLLVFMAAHLLQIPFAVTEQRCLLILTCFKSWDQELSPDLMLKFMAVHFFQFRFAVAGRYWHPSYLFTLTFFRTPAHGVGHGGPRGLSVPATPMPFMQQEIWILHTVSSSSEHQLRSAWTLMSLFQQQLVRSPCRMMVLEYCQ